jgi:hypothetical protein
MPILCLSPLAIHTRNLAEDAACSLVVQMPGWTGLANARATIFGDVHRLPQEMQVRLHAAASAGWAGEADWADWADSVGLGGLGGLGGLCGLGTLGGLTRRGSDQARV